MAREIHDLEGGTGIPWHALSLDTVFILLVSSPQGLDQEMARIRSLPLARQVPSPSRSFQGVMLLLIAAGFAVDAWLGVASLLVLLAHCRNPGWLKSGRSVRVVRHGGISRIGPGAVVAGDVVLFCTGDRIPADLRLVEGDGIQCLEPGKMKGRVFKRVTIEPLCATANPANMISAGSKIVGGIGLGVVVETPTSA